MMADDIAWGLLLPRQLRELPADLAAVAILTITAVLSVALPVIRDTPLRIIFGLPFVLFLPGYALIAALFPEAGTGPVGDGPDGDGTTKPPRSSDGDDRITLRDGRGIDGIERVALSFGLSIAVVPLIGLVLNFTPWGIRLAPIVIAVGGFTLIASAVAAYRRWELPPEERFSVPYRSWLASTRSELLEPESRVDGVLNVVLIASIVLAVGSVGFAIAVPSDGESFTEFYYLSETENGELVADDYPTEFTAGEAQPLVVGIGNEEHQETNYTVVIEIQNVTFGGPNGTDPTVHAQEALAQYSVALAHNETSHQTVQLRPTLVGENLRMQLLLYRGSAPDDPSAESAYRDTHLWVNVSSG